MNMWFARQTRRRRWHVLPGIHAARLVSDAVAGVLGCPPPRQDADTGPRVAGTHSTALFTLRLNY